MKNINIIPTFPDRYEIRESFRKIRSNIIFSGKDLKVISVTSATQHEGKSVVSMELAKSMSSTERKVLFIDADIRKSVIADKYITETGLLGLSHYLSGQVSSDDILYETQFPNLYMILSGPYPPNPVELLGSNRFSELIEKCREEFDYVIIDTPPLCHVIDAAVVSNCADGVIMNIAAKRISTKMANDVKYQLERGGCKIIGAILNFAESSGSTYNYYNKYSSYISEREQKNFASLETK